MKQKLIYITILAVILFYACKKETFITSKDARITLTSDSLRFDTVFTSIGSTTQSFKVINENNQKLKLSSIILKGGANASFKINADGVIGPIIKDIEIDANDSIYIFVTVNINPTFNNLPFIVSDSIEVNYNNNKKMVQLQAWGQNAIFLRNKKIIGNVTWLNNLPYVIDGNLQIDTTATLTIEKGCKIYLHANAAFLVDGTLKANGEKFDSTRIYFNTDRLDYPYKNYPGSWAGIYFRTQSKNNVLQYTVIQNAFQGIVVKEPSINANPKLILNECIISNIFDAGIAATQTSIVARNCLVSNCGADKESNGNIAITLGGNYSFNHCTVVGINNNYVSHVHPVLSMVNYAIQKNGIVYADLAATFTNCIFWGDSLQDGNEVIIDKKNTNNFSAQFNNCLWRQKTMPLFITASAIINIQGENKDTLIFNTLNREKKIYDFRLKDNSAAINKGINTSTSIDLDGKNRPIGLPDIGCYEKQ